MRATAQGNTLTINTVGGTPGGFACRGPGQGPSFVFGFNSRGGAGGSSDTQAEAVYRFVAVTPGNANSANFWHTDSQTDRLGDWYLPLQSRPITPVAAGQGAVTAGFTTNGGLETLAPQLGQVFDATIPLSGAVDFVNRPGGCPLVAAQGVNRINLVRGEGAKPCSSAGQRWQLSLNGANITPLLDPAKPFSQVGRELVLNFRTPLASQRCTAAQVAAYEHQWVLYVGFGGQCLKISTFEHGSNRSLYYLQLPVITLNAAP